MKLSLPGRYPPRYERLMVDSIQGRGTNGWLAGVYNHYETSHYPLVNKTNNTPVASYFKNLREGFIDLRTSPSLGGTQSFFGE